MSEECKKHRTSPIVGPRDCPSCAMEKIRGERHELSVENQRLRSKVEALRSGLERAREVISVQRSPRDDSYTAGAQFRSVEIAAIDSALQARP